MVNLQHHNKVDIQVNTVETDGTVIGVQYVGLTTDEVRALFLELKREEQPKVWNGRNPYLGLNAFHEADAQYFFGRESLVDELLQRLEQSKFITIAGSSGSGKSSIARAGLYNALRQGRIERSEHWLLATMQPRNNPLDQLAIALERVTKSTSVGDIIRQDPARLERQIEIYLTDDRKQRFVLLVDQFEELFTQTKDPQARTAFINVLTKATQAAQSRIIVVICLRADFISQCAAYSDLRHLINQEFQLVGAMSPHDLGKAITLPALEVGAAIDPKLVSRVIADLKGEPGALPLMSFALRDLFEKEKNEIGEPMDLKLPEYLAIGGIESALERHAGKVFQAFSAEEQTLAKRVFSKLIEVGQGRLDTRRTATFAELIPADSSAEKTRAVIRALTQEDVRLITTDGGNGQTTPTVTIAHEKLIDAWPWLRQLVDENRELIALQNRIFDDAKAWDMEQDSGFLYRGGRLLQAEERLEALAGYLDQLSHNFIAASIDQRQKEIAAEKARQQREIEIVQQQVELEAKTSQRLRRLLLVALTFLAFSILATVIATQQSRLSTARGLRAQSNLEISQHNNPHAAALLALEANRLVDSEGDIIFTEIAQQATNNTFFPDVVFDGHLDKVYSATWSPQGDRLASGSDDGTVIIWDAETGEPLMTLSGHMTPVWAVAWSPQGDRLASGSEDGRVIIWDAETGELLMTLSGHMTKVLALAWSPHEEQLASASSDILIVWDTISGEHVMTSEGNLDRFRSVAWSPQGDRMAASSFARVIVWDMVSGEQLADLHGHFVSVWSIAWSPQGDRLASASEDRDIIIWDVAAEEQLMILEGHSSEVLSVAWSPQGERLASAAGDDLVIVWDAITGERLATLAGHSDFVLSVAWSPQGNRLASASFDETVIIWETNAKEQMLTLAGHFDDVRSIAWSPDGTRLASASSDKSIFIWDTVTGGRLKTLTDPSRVNGVAWSPQGKWLAAGRSDGAVIFWDAIAWEARVPRFTYHSDRVRDVVWSPKGEYLASASDDNSVIIWDSATRKPLTSLIGHSGSVWSVAWSPEGDYLASASTDNSIIIWDTRTWESLINLEEHTSSVNRVAWSPEGDRLASASDDSSIIIWDRATWDPFMNLQGHANDVNGIAWSLNGERLASASSDKTVIIWNSRTGEQLRIFNEHTHPVNSLAWSPQGDQLAFASDDRKIYVWPDRLVHPPCDWLKMNLTLKQWQQYMGNAFYNPTCSNLPSPPVSWERGGWQNVIIYLLPWRIWVNVTAGLLGFGLLTWLGARLFSFFAVPVFWNTKNSDEIL